MKIKNNFLLRKVADSYVVVPVGKMSLDFNGIITLNETGAFLFELLQKGCEREDLIAKLLDEYEVSAGRASADVPDRRMNRKGNGNEQYRKSSCSLYKRKKRNRESAGSFCSSDPGVRDRGRCACRQMASPGQSALA